MFDIERSRDRKRSQNEYRKSIPRFDDMNDDDDNSFKMQSNDKIISVIGENMLRNIRNSTSSVPNSKILNINNQNNRLNDKKKSTKYENIRSHKERHSLRKNNPFDICPVPSRMNHDISLAFNGKILKKSEEELFLDHQYNTIEFFLKSITDKNKAFKQMHENKDNSSSNLGLSNSNARSMSLKSEEKNTKINLQNIMENDRRIIKRETSPCIILSDKMYIESNDNKLDFLIKIMEEYKEIIMEKIFCKNVQDRIILSIYISLSQISLKLYDCTEKPKLNNLRKYICGLTDNIKYDLLNNPNFTLSCINQKFIDIIDIKNQAQNEIKTEENDIDFSKKIDFSINYSSSKNRSSSSLLNNPKEKYRWFFDDDEEEIIYENFEDFNEFNGNDKDYVYGGNIYDLENQNNNPNDNNINFHKNISNEEDNTLASKLPKNKIRRNATHKIAFEKKEINKNYLAQNYNTNNTSNLNQNKYDFQIIDINGNENIKGIDYSDESSDSEEEGCHEVHENHKYDLPKLLFYEDHVKDKDKRKISKNNHVEIMQDQNFIKDKLRIKELNEKGINNIITIINKDPNLLPNHELNLNPFEIENFIEEREKKYLEQKNSSINSSSSINSKSLNSEKEENKKNDEDNQNTIKNNISFFSHIDKSISFIHDEQYSKNKILNFGNEEEEDT